MKGAWTRSIMDFDEKTWSEIFKNDILKSYSLAKAVEDAKLSNIEHYYLDIKHDGEIVGILPCFTLTIGLDLLTTKAIKTVVKYIRKYLPRFLKIDIFCVGTPIAICDHLIGIASPGDTEAVFAIMLEKVREQAKQLKCVATLIKEIPEKDHLLLRLFAENDIVIGSSLPNSYVFLDDRLGNWPDAFRNRYRRRIKTQMKNVGNNKDYTWKIVQNFSEYSGRFEDLYLQVLDKSDYKFEQLTAGYFSAVDKELGEKSFALVCTDSSGNVVCFELIVAKEDTIIPLYVGIDYAHKKSGDLYFTCINKLVLIAEEMGFKKIKFGQTSYLAKAYVGAVFEELKSGIFSHKRFLHALFRAFGSQLFTAPNLPDIMVYRDDLIPVVKCIATEHNIITTVVQKEEHRPRLPALEKISRKPKILHNA